MALTSSRPLYLEPGITKIVHGYGLNASFETDFDTLTPVYRVFDIRSRRYADLVASDLVVLARQDDFDELKMVVHRACEQVLDEMGGLFALADEGKRA